MEGHLLLTAEKGYKTELLANEAAGSVNAFRIKLTAPDSTSVIYYFDPADGYIIKTISQAEMQGQMMENVMSLSDYRQADGYALPYKTTIDMGGQFEIISNVTKVEVNIPVDEAIFVKPL